MDGLSDRHRCANPSALIVHRYVMMFNWRMRFFGKFPTQEKITKELVDFRLSSDSKLVTSDFKNEIGSACKEVFENLGELQPHVENFRVQFACIQPEKGASPFRAEKLSSIGITAFVNVKNGGRTHFTKWMPYLESKSIAEPPDASILEIHPTREEIARSFSESLIDFINKRQV
ncbi:MAG: hypothetical protein Q7S01_04770 [bacterium]|nr:hypothetical protein [bacterium]